MAYNLTQNPNYFKEYTFLINKTENTTKLSHSKIILTSFGAIFGFIFIIFILYMFGINFKKMKFQFKVIQRRSTKY